MQGEGLTMAGEAQVPHATAKTGRARLLATLFAEYFKIALFVVGGGYAIIAVADNVFGRRLKLLKEGELLEHLPVFQMIPGIIAGNSAIYTGLKLAGRTGAAVALCAVALPSIIIFTLVSCGYGRLPLGNPILDGAFAGLRSSLAGIIAGTIAAGWKRSIRGAYGYIALAAGVAALNFTGLGTFRLLAIAIAAGIALEYCGLGDSGAIDSAGVELAPLPMRCKILLACALVAGVALATAICGPLFAIFAKFGIMCFGGGFVLVPAYLDQFVGPSAPLLNLSEEEFGNLLALTQMTPGPVAVNSATFFGFRLHGVIGAIVATAGLFTPSFILLTAALSGLERWKMSRVVQGLMRGVRPATVALMVTACATFARLSIVTRTAGGYAPSPLGIALFAFSGIALLSRRLQVMGIIFICAAAGALSAWAGP